MKSLREQLVKALEACGEPHYQIAKSVGIAPSMLSRLRSGERNVSIETAEKLAVYLKCKIVLQPMRRKGK